jgi:hypothetical protein
MSAPDPMEAEPLIPPSRRIVTPDDQLAFRQSLATPPPADPIDEEMEDRLCRVPLPMRKESEARRVLDILDEIEGVRRSA